MVVQELSSTQKEHRGQFLHTGIAAPARSAGARTGRVKENREPSPRAGAPRRRGDPGVQDLSTALFLCAVGKFR